MAGNERALTQEQLQLLACLRAYVGNQPLEQAFFLNAEQWSTLYRMAAAHKMTAVVYETLHGVREFCRDVPELKQRWKRDAIFQSVGQTTRSQRILEIAQALNRAQIPYAVVKGIICRQMYGKPDLRPSGDEDILIFPEDRERCECIFQSFGLNPTNDAGETEVAHWMDPRSGLHIELHRALLPPDWEMARVLNPYFMEHLPRGVMLEAEGRPVRTLDPTAHFVFLVVHALKHFIAGGFGVRTMADVVVFAKTYAEEIDRRQVLELLEQIHGRVFLEQMIAIGEKYLGLELRALGWKKTENVDFGPMLQDMLDAGIYGQSTMDRRHSASLLVQNAAGSGRPSLRSVLFPSASALSGRYPELREKPGLLPVVWTRRLGRYAAEVIRSRGRGSSPTEAVSMAHRRQELMEYYRIFPADREK